MVHVGSGIEWNERKHAELTAPTLSCFPSHSNVGYFMCQSMHTFVEKIIHQSGVQHRTHILVMIVKPQQNAEPQVERGPPSSLTAAVRKGD